MKFLLLILTASTLLAGCATDPEDKAFYERGWVHPGDLDKPVMSKQPQ